VAKVQVDTDRLTPDEVVDAVVTELEKVSH